MRLSPTGLIYYTKDKSVLFSPRLNSTETYCVLQLTNAKWPLIDLPIILIHYACGGLGVSDETQILSIIYEVNFWSIMLFYVSEFISIHYWTPWWKRLWQWDCWHDQVNKDSESIIKHMIQQLKAPMKSKLKFCNFFSKSHAKKCLNG